MARSKIARLAAKKADDSIEAAPPAIEKVLDVIPLEETGNELASARLRGSQAVRAFMTPAGTISIDRAAKWFGMSKAQLAETIGVKPATVHRVSRVTAQKTQLRAIEMLEIVGRIADWAGGEKQAMAWYRAEPIPAFGGRTAEFLVKEGKATAVREYLDHLARGGFA
jgi:uncharacterized protein (DUF2384 family)